MSKPKNEFTPIELEEARNQAGALVAKLAAALGTTERTYYRWKSGETVIPAWVPYRLDEALVEACKPPLCRGARTLPSQVGPRRAPPKPGHE